MINCRWLDKGKGIWDPRGGEFGDSDWEMYDTADSSGCHICLLSIGGFTNGNLCNLYKEIYALISWAKVEEQSILLYKIVSLFAFQLETILNNTKVAYFGEAYSNPPSQGIIVPKMSCPCFYNLIYALNNMNSSWILTSKFLSFQSDWNFSSLAVVSWEF